MRSDLDTAIATLARHDREPVEAALDALRQAGPEVVPRLRGAWDGAVNTRQRQALVRLVGELGGASDVDWLLTRSSTVDAAVEWALLQMGPVAVDPLREAIRPASRTFSAGVGRALAALWPATGEWLAERLGATRPSYDEDEVYSWLCERVDDRHADCEALIESVHHHALHGDGEHRLEAIEALVRLGADEEVLVTCIERLPPMSSWFVVTPLQRISTHLHAPEVRERAWRCLRRWLTGRFETPAILRLRSELGDREATEALLKHLVSTPRNFSTHSEVTGHAPCAALRERLRELRPLHAGERKDRILLCLAIQGDDEGAAALVERVPTLDVGTLGSVVAALRWHAPHHLEALVPHLDTIELAIARHVFSHLARCDTVADATAAALVIHWQHLRNEADRTGDRMARRIFEDTSLAVLAHAQLPLAPELVTALDEALANQVRVLREYRRQDVHGGVLHVEHLDKSSWLQDALEQLPRHADRLTAAGRATLGERLTELTGVLDDYARQLPRYHDGTSKLATHHRAAVRAALVFGHHGWEAHLPEPLRRALAAPNERILDEAMRELARRNVLAATRGPA